jgi:Flp pilus assembly protein TadD
LSEAGDAAGALEITAKLVAEDPRNPEALYNLGALYANAGDIPKAREYWAKATQVAPGSDGATRARTALDRTASTVASR